MMLYNKNILKNCFYNEKFLYVKYMKTKTLYIFCANLEKFYRFFPSLIFKAFEGGSKGRALV